jgi:hypothetical protein
MTQLRPPTGRRNTPRALARGEKSHTWTRCLSRCENHARFKIEQCAPERSRMEGRSAGWRLATPKIADTPGAAVARQGHVQCRPQQYGS